MKFESIENNVKSLSKQVADQIMQMVVDKKLEAGSKIPNEFDLAKQLNVGRGTIREAIKILVSQNILEIKRGNGTFVTDNPGVVNDPLGLAFFEDKYQLALDMFEVRYMIEPQIAGLAAIRATKQDILDLEKSCLAVEEKIKQGVNHIKEDKQFHETIAKASQNQVVPNLIPIIYSSIELFVDITDSKLTEQTIKTHQEIVEQITQHNQKKAEDAMKQHLECNKAFIIEKGKKKK